MNPELPTGVYGTLLLDFKAWWRWATGWRRSSPAAGAMVEAGVGSWHQIRRPTSQLQFQASPLGWGGWEYSPLGAEVHSRDSLKVTCWGGWSDLSNQKLRRRAPRTRSGFRPLPASPLMTMLHFFCVSSQYQMFTNSIIFSLIILGSMDTGDTKMSKTWPSSSWTSSIKGILSRT